YTQTMALMSDGKLWTWGDTAYGQLGDGTTTSRLSPVEVVGPGGAGFLNLAVIDTQAPTVPEGLTATALSASAIYLAWTASTDNVLVTQYKIFRNGTQIGVSATTYYVDNDLAPSTIYTYRVSACDAATNCSAQSNPASTMTQAAPDTQAPTIPTGLVALPVGASQISLSWSASSDNVGVTAYWVYRNGGLIAILGNVTSYGDTGLSASTVYEYSVAACDAAGNCSLGSPTVSARTAKVRADFDGDGKSDILWRNSSTGENYLYPVDGTTILPTEGYIRAMLDQDWQVAGIGDFDGDGKADILWRNASTGQNYLYPMDGAAINPSEGFIRTVADLAWQVKGVGDVDGDGKADIVWRNSATGQNYLYPMEGTTIKATEGYLRTVTDLDWQIVAVGDYDGDGKSDLLWRNSST